MAPWHSGPERGLLCPLGDPCMLRGRNTVGWVWWAALVENREKTWTPVVCSPSPSASKAGVGWWHHLWGDKVLDTSFVAQRWGL